MRNKTNLVQVLFVALLLALLAACAGPAGNVMPVDPLEPYKRVEIGANTLYAAQWNDYQAQTAHPEQLTDAQKAVLAARRELLVKFETALKAYRAFLDLKQAPTPEAAATLTDLINQVEAKIGK